MRRLMIGLALLAVVVVPSVAVGHGDEPEGKATHSPQCEKSRDLIGQKGGQFKSRRDQHGQAYERILNRLEAIIDKLADQGFDTTKLRQDRQALAGRVAKFRQDYQTYQQQLTELRDVRCGHSDGEFKGQLQETRAQMKVVHGDAASIRDLIRNTIKPRLKELKGSSKPESSPG